VSERAPGVETFPVTADPDSYVETAAGEDALEALRRAIREGRAPVVLVGAAGVGKTLLLRVLERRLVSSFRVVYLPFAALPADELCTWILGLLGENAGRDPERDLLAASLRLEGSGSALVVMLDDAASMPVATARRLSALLAESEGALRLVLALAEDSRSDQMLSSFRPEATRVELRTLLNAEETARYLRAHLIRSHAPKEIRARFDPTSIGYLHRGSGGVPRVLNGLASEVARGNLSVLPRHETAPRDEPLGFGSEPFEVTSDPADYVPRRVTQELLESVQSSLRKGARAIAVTGPPGLGKTMLLRVLERRLRAAFRTVRISYTALLPGEFLRWILKLAGEPVTESADEALLELADRLAHSRTALVLLLDDAGAIPIPTLRRLMELAAEADGAMRVVLFAAEDARTASILEALGPDTLTIRFNEPMAENETAEYVHAHLTRAGAPSALVRLFDPEVVAQLHFESAGIPRELHRLASELCRQGSVGRRAPGPERAEARAGYERVAVLPPPEPSAPVATQPAPPPIPTPAPVPTREVVPRREPVPMREPVSEREPASERPASRGRLVVLGLLVVAALLIAFPLLRGGLPWLLATPGADRVAAPPVAVQPAAAPPAAVQPPEMPAPPAPPAPEESQERIAVNINATPWASVEVDGEYLGVTPLAGVLLPPGLHVFRARMADGEVREHRVEVGPTMRHVVFYAELGAEEIEPVPETPPAPLSPVPEELSDVAVEPAEPPREEVREISIAPVQLPSPRAPEPAPPPPVPEPAVAAVPAPPLASEPTVAAVPAPPPPVPEEVLPEIAVESSQPSREAVSKLAVEVLLPSPLPEEPAETAAGPSEPPREKVPETSVRTQQVASAREPEPAPPHAVPQPISVSINATPWATIEIDGEEIGVTPMAGVLLAPGDHTFRVRMPDGAVREEIVRIAPDNRHIAFGQ